MYLALVAAACGRYDFAAHDAAGGGGDGSGSATRDGAIDAPDLTTGLTAAFTLDALAGNKVPAAFGGDGWAASTTDVTQVAGRVGGALHFDGVGYMGYALFPATSGGMCAAQPSYPNGLTVAAWVNFDSFHDWNTYTLGVFAVGQGSSGGTQGMWGLGETNGCGGTPTVGFTVAFTDANRATRCGRTALQIGTWYHLVGVFDPVKRNVYVYVNGADDTGALTGNSSAIATTLNPPPTCPYLAASSNQSQLLIGALDEVKVYDRALTAAEVAALYATY